MSKREQQVREEIERLEKLHDDARWDMQHVIEQRIAELQDELKHLKEKP
jgi:hypothetical protein